MIGHGANSVTAVALDDQIYILGYSDEKIELEVYNIKNNSWTVKAPEGAALYSTRNLEAVNGKIYAIVSYNKDDVNILIQEYDPKTNKCILLAGTSTKRSSFASVVFNGEIYLIGGIDSYTEKYVKPVEKFSPHKD